MIWKLRIECVRGFYLESECVRVLEINSKTSLLHLHSAIHAAVNFDRDHAFEFFAGRTPSNKKMKLIDDLDLDESYCKYGKMILEQIYPLPKSCKLYYHYDFGDDWYFEIRKLRAKPVEPVPGVKYPCVIESIGPNPKQYGNWED